MDPAALIPDALEIPAPVWLLEFLGALTLVIHLIFINVVLGGALISLFNRLRCPEETRMDSVPGSMAKKIPTVLAMAITFGVAPLLFVQVLYGHFFYTNSILMGIYWILIIPFLIVAYFSFYYHSVKFDLKRGASVFALSLGVAILLYIAFMFENNVTMMLQPDKWTAYFDHRGGTILNLSDPAIYPRYIHFLTASLAVASLFIALVWNFRKNRGVAGADEKVKTYLRLFGFATMFQIVVGFWFLIALPKNVMMTFMGQNMAATVSLALGILLAMAAIMTAMMNRVWLTSIITVLTVAVMIMNRIFVRDAYFEPYFSADQLEVVPQYQIMTIFLVIFVIGLGVIGYMIKLWLDSVKNEEVGA